MKHTSWVTHLALGVVKDIRNTADHISGIWVGGLAMNILAFRKRLENVPAIMAMSTIPIRQVTAIMGGVIVNRKGNN